MKPRILKNYPPTESPYELFSPQKIISSLSKKNKNPHNNPKSLFSTYAKSRPYSTFQKNSPPIITSITKSLKSVTLSSQQYGDYINYYTNITQEYTFKSPQVINYPLLKNEKYLPITSQNYSTDKSIINNENNKYQNDNNTKSFFLSFMRETKNRKKYIQEKPYGFKYGNTKIKYDRGKSAFSYTAGMNFGELCENNIFESKLLKLIGIKNIDMYNSTTEKNKNFSFFKEYLKKIDELNDLFIESNFHRNIKFKWKTAIKKEIIDFNLDIDSLCFKFYTLDNNSNNCNNNTNKEKKNNCQKLYFPYELLPIFYLLDYTSFKVFLSEIINFDINTNSFIFIKENVLLKKIKKYYKYAINLLNTKPDYISKITYNKNEPNFPLIYDWIISKNNINNLENNVNNNNNINKSDYLCFKLKISLPKIKFNIDTLDIKIFKYLNKHIIANLLHNKFIDWEKFIFFDLFSTKKFKLMMNYIMLNKHYKITEKKIYLNKKTKIQNKVLEFYITQTGENTSSFFYTFIPYIILILFGEKEKKFQKINLSLKESKNLIKFKKYWGVMNTLFKCMFIDTMTNKIYFRLNLLDDNFNELYKLVVKENAKNNNNIINDDLNDDINSDINNINTNNNNTINNIKKISSKNSNLRDKDKEKDKIQTKYKDNMFEISLLNCTLQKIIIFSLKSEYKYYNVPPNILKCIFNLKDETKIFNTNYKSLSIIGKCIGENSSLILTSKEASIISEEQAMIKKLNKKDLLDNKNQDISPHSSSSHRIDGFNRLKSFQNLQNNNTFNFLRKTSKNKLSKDTENEILKTKTSKNLVINNNNNNLDENNINKNKNIIKNIMNTAEISVTKSLNHQRRVSITDVNTLKKSRIEYGETERDKNKRKTSNYVIQEK